MHILRYMHFIDNNKEVDENNNNYDTLWKTKEVSDILDVAY